MSAPPLRLALVGLGNVGCCFLRLLPGSFGRVLRQTGVAPRVTGVATARHGFAVDPDGLRPDRILACLHAGRSLQALNRGRPIASTLDLIRRAPADVVVEISTLDPRRGEPATRHVRAALERGLHVVTANKGPVACARARLRRLAERRGVLFLHEAAVMDGTPVFNLVERCLPGARVTGFRGVLNTTTTRILTGMERGLPFAEALRRVQAEGIAEADSSHDIAGWDAAVKACALAATLMDARVTPTRVRRRGILGLDARRLRAALRRGFRYRLVARAVRRGREVQVSVSPERLRADDVLAGRDSDGVLVIETDLAGEVGIWQGQVGVEQTAYGLLSDLVAVASRLRARRLG